MRPHSPSPKPPLLTSTGRLLRNYRLPGRYIDHPADSPEGPITLPPVAPGSTVLPRVILHVRDSMYTVRNRFGIRRDYLHRPSYDPNSAVSDAHLSTYYAKYQPEHNQLPSKTSDTTHPPPWPFQNMSTYLLMEWMNTGSLQKSVGEVDRLATSVLAHPQFTIKDLTEFSARKEAARLDQSDENGAAAPPFLSDGWQESSVEIEVPLGSKDN